MNSPNLPPPNEHDVQLASAKEMEARFIKLTEGTAYVSFHFIPDLTRERLSRQFGRSAGNRTDHLRKVIDAMANIEDDTIRSAIQDYISGHPIDSIETTAGVTIDEVVAALDEVLTPVKQRRRQAVIGQHATRQASRESKPDAEETFDDDDETDLDVEPVVDETEPVAESGVAERPVGPLQKGVRRYREGDDTQVGEQKLSGVAFNTADPVKDWMRQAGKRPLLNAKQEVDLAQQIEVGLFAEERLDETPDLDEQDRRDLHRLKKEGQRAMTVLMESNLRLVINLAKRYTGRGMAFLDLVQEGNMGLQRAAQKFDYMKGFKFSTYATWWIRQAITRSMADQARAIRIPVHMVEVMNKLARVKRELLQDLGREPTNKELAWELQMTPQKVDEVLKYGRDPISLNTPIGDDGDSEFGDLIAERNTVDTVDSLAEEERNKQLEKILDSLPVREAEVIRLRFGIGYQEPMTLQDIADQFDISRERIRQIETKAMLKLRSKLPPGSPEREALKLL